jgi:hypothetical protein
VSSNEAIIWYYASAMKNIYIVIGVSYARKRTMKLTVGAQNMT